MSFAPFNSLSNPVGEGRGEAIPASPFNSLSNPVGEGRGEARPASPSNSLSTRGEGRSEARPASPSNSLSNGVGEGRGEASALWLFLSWLLAEIDPDVRGYVQQVFADTLEAVERDLALPPEQRRIVPEAFLVQHLARPRFHKVALWEQNQKEIGGLLRCALWRAVDALEAAVLVPQREVYLSILTEQCAQFERVYQHLKKRAGDGWAAQWIVYGEVKLLRHRGSRVIQQMLFS
jgi:hypothetical protein